jgi:hypothetical protein
MGAGSSATVISMSPATCPCQQGSLFISGHTHVPVLRQEGELVLMNPGSICFPRGEWVASYGRYEDGCMSIHACKDGETDAAGALTRADKENQKGERRSGLDPERAGA